MIEIVREIKRIDQAHSAARNLASDLADAHAPAEDLACAWALAHDLVLARDLVLDLDLVDGLVYVLSGAVVRARALASNNDRALILTLILADQLDLAVIRARDRSADKAKVAVAGDGQAIPGQVSRGLVALAVRLLPVAQRPRYREEFRGDLIELPRRQRRGYALRVLVSAWELRRALNETVRTPDGEPARRAER